MTPGIKRLRKILNPPPIKGFNPYGPDCEAQKNEPVILLYEEYEALRLCDFDMYNHHFASEIMGISRPTFTRIYALTRQKIAKAFVEGRQISIEGGKVYFDSDWFHCNKCNCYFNNPEKEVTIILCPLCGSKKIKNFDFDNTIEVNDTKECNDFCVCPNCGFEQQHLYGNPCSHQVCPKCNGFMKRKGKLNCKNTQ